jgi:hypothetical protein
VEINESITLPEIKKMIRMPESVEKPGNAASYQGGYTLANGAVIFSGTSVFKKRQYEPVDWPDFKAAVEAQNRFTEQPVIVEL